MLFRDLGALDAALKLVSLSRSLKRSLEKTARPTIAFTRTLQSEADIPIGASKIGGDPDLPPDFPWPWRGPYSWGEFYAAKLRKQAEETTHRPEEYYVMADAVVRDFPLAFLCQINLDALAKEEPGFDSALFPERGRLLVFVDICDCPTGHDPGNRSWLRLIWDETPVERLERREAPEILKKAGATIVLEDKSAWDDWSEAEILTAFSGVSISVEELDYSTRRILKKAGTTIVLEDKSTWGNWPTAETPTAFSGVSVSVEELDDSPRQDALLDKPLLHGSGRLGEQLGGWCDPIYGSPVPEIVGAVHGLNIYKHDLSPSERRAFWGLAYKWPKWQHVLTIAGEPSTYRTPINWFDGNLYVFMHQKDLQTRRFEMARGVAQMLVSSAGQGVGVRRAGSRQYD